MKFVIYDERCATVPAEEEGVDAELRIQAIGRASKAKAVAQTFSKTGDFKGSINVEKHRKGYSVNINDKAAVSIIYGHENSGRYKDVPGRADGHREIIDALFS